jgi:hypothetical protein
VWRGGVGPGIDQRLKAHLPFAKPDRAMAFGAPRPAIHHRESAGRRREYRNRGGRACPGGRLHARIGRCFLKARLAELGGDVLALSPLEFGKFMADETEKWGKVI